MLVIVKQRLGNVLKPNKARVLSQDMYTYSSLNYQTIPLQFGLLLRNDLHPTSHRQSSHVSPSHPDFMLSPHVTRVMSTLHCVIETVNDST
jgi:hypothetical protein